MSEESPLERLKKKLYAPGARSTVIPTLSEQPSVQTPEGWHDEPKTIKKHFSIAALFLIIAVGFFVVAGVVAAGILYFGARSVSTDSVSITIDGPVTISSGDSVSLLISVTNENPSTITATTIKVDFPDGTRNSDNPEEPLVRYTDTLGDLAPGDREERTVRASFFGGENQLVTVPVMVEYRTEGSNAVFVAEKQFTFTIATSPISLSVESLSEIQSGQPFSVTLRARSNATVPLRGVAVVPVLPFGFTLTSSEPVLTSGLISLGDMQPGEERLVVVRGTLTGQEGDERVFRFTVGTANGQGGLASAYTSKDTDVTITKSFLAVALGVNQQTENPAVIQAGAKTTVSVSWANTLSVPITDGQILVKLQGEALDPYSIQVANGYYRSSDATVVFNRESTSALATLRPGETGSGTIMFTTKPSTTQLRNPTVTLAVSVTGRRMSESQVPETVTATASRTLQIATNVALTSRGLRTIGPFQNTGPWPPAPDTESTYTITLSLANTVNSVGGAVVTTSLPSFVRFTGATSPADGSISYNETTRILSWNVGDVPAGTSTKEASFQVAVLPSLSQRGEVLELVREQLVSGTDRFTGKKVTDSAPAVTTEIRSDPAYQSSFGVVKK